MLLSNGDVDVYSKSREALQQQLDLADLALMLGQAPAAFEPASGAGHGTAAPARDDDGTAATGAAAGAAAGAAGDDDVDRFAEEGPAAAASGASAGDAAGDAHMQDAAAPAAGSPTSPTAAAAAAPAATPAAPAAPAATPAAPAAPAADAAAGIMEGFVLDEASGCFYSSATGYWFDPRSQLFSDAASGLAYRYSEEAGGYQLVTGSQPA
jgi:hypothetical protein